jgi:integrase
MARRPKGTGSVFLRGRIWWIQYYAHGQPMLESSGGADRDEAVRQLTVKLGEIAAGQDVVPEKCTIGDLCKLVVADYKIRKLRDAHMVEWRYNLYVKPVVGNLPAARFSVAQVRKYIETRRASGASDASINRELAIVRRGFSLGREEEPPLVHRAPKIPKLEEDNARQGFLEPDEYEKLLSELPERLKALFVCAYHLGGRKGELRKLQWEQVDLDGGVIRIERRQAKSKKPRTLPIYGDMRRWLDFQAKNRPEGCAWVFNHYRKPVGAIMREWRAACQRAGVPDLLFHDLRRTAVRNLERAGVPRKVAMDITGHKTESVYRRYDIVDEGDIHDAAKRLEQYAAKRKEQRAVKLKRVK